MAAAQLDDVGRCKDWLLGNVPDLRSPLAVELLAAGRSNLSFVVTDAAGRRLVLRRRPPGPGRAASHDVRREGRVMHALHGTGVPVPEILGVAEDDAMPDAPFVVMTFVDGSVIDRPSAAARLDPAARLDAARTLVDALAALHRVDVDAVGLGSFAPRDGFFERQLRRWTTVWSSVATRDVPEIHEVARLLGQEPPGPQALALVHGDFRFGNCIVDPVSGGVRAVIDWELCTLGDPLADVGYLRAWWGDGVPYDPTAEGGFPAFADLAARYEAATGFDLGALDRYVALAWWRLAVINEDVYARARRGAVAEADLDLGALASATIDRARRALATLVPA